MVLRSRTFDRASKRQTARVKSGDTVMEKGFDTRKKWMVGEGEIEEVIFF